MTVVILARTYGDAYDAAQHLGIGPSWIYPHEAILLRGVLVSRVIYVEGWEQSELPGDALMELASRMPDETQTTILRPDAPYTPEAGPRPFTELDIQPAPARIVRRRIPWWWWPLPIGAALSGLIGLANLLGWW